jgi:hypothetical protein
MNNIQTFASSNRLVIVADDVQDVLKRSRSRCQDLVKVLPQAHKLAKCFRHGRHILFHYQKAYWMDETFDWKNAEQDELNETSQAPVDDVWVHDCLHRQRTRFVLDSLFNGTEFRYHMSIRIRQILLPYFP